MSSPESLAEPPAELICYLHPGWKPFIRPAPATRPWMDATADSFAYRCLPLNIANAHGWEVLNPYPFEAEWDGRPGVEGVTIREHPEAGITAPVSLFGHGVLTFHVQGIFRTPPGWNLFVGGSPNRFKDAIAPLSGVIETDWSPFTFTMNWRFTRTGCTVRFGAMEPFCFLFPVQRDAVESFAPRFESLENDPATLRRFKSWSDARNAFHERMRVDPPAASSERWQKHYYRGVDAAGEKIVADHRAKLRLKRFDKQPAPEVPDPPLEDVSAPENFAPDVTELETLRRTLAQRDWLLAALERQRDLVPGLAGLERRSDLGAEEFLERYYAVNRPVIFTRDADVPAPPSQWTESYVKDAIGGRLGGEALAALAKDLGFLERFLDLEADLSNGAIWIGGAGGKTALEAAPVNQLLVQIVGGLAVRLVPAGEIGKLRDVHPPFGEVADLDDPTLTPQRFPHLGSLRLYEIELAAGEVLFVPLGWRRQAQSLEFGVTIACESFRWDNGSNAARPRRHEVDA